MGFIINKSFKQNIEIFTGFLECVALLNLTFEQYKVSLIQAYAPTDAAKEEEIMFFYKTITQAIEAAHKDYVIMADFNAKIGQPQQIESLVMRSYGYGERNDKGQKLIDFAIENKLSIL